MKVLPLSTKTDAPPTVDARSKGANRTGSTTFDTVFHDGRIEAESRHSGTFDPLAAGKLIDDAPAALDIDGPEAVEASNTVTLSETGKPKKKISSKQSGLHPFATEKDSSVKQSWSAELVKKKSTTLAIATYEPRSPGIPRELAQTIQTPQKSDALDYQATLRSEKDGSTRPKPETRSSAASVSVTGDRELTFDVIGPSNPGGSVRETNHDMFNASENSLESDAYVSIGALSSIDKSDQSKAVISIPDKNSGTMVTSTLHKYRESEVLQRSLIDSISEKPKEVNQGRFFEIPNSDTIRKENIVDDLGFKNMQNNKLTPSATERKAPAEIRISVFDNNPLMEPMLKNGTTGVTLSEGMTSRTAETEEFFAGYHSTFSTKKKPNDPKQDKTTTFRDQLVTNTANKPINGTVVSAPKGFVDDIVIHSPSMTDRGAIADAKDNSSVFASTSLAADAPGIAGPRPTNETVSIRADAAKLPVGQIVEVVTRQAERAVEVALSPKELGHVKMSLTAHDGSLTLVVSADRSDTLDLMRRHIEVLAQEFRRLGYSDLGFEFSQNTAGDNRDPQRTERFNSVDEGPTSALEPMATEHRNDAQSSGLDLRI